MRGVQRTKCAVSVLMLSAMYHPRIAMADDKIELTFAPLQIEGDSEAKSIRMIKDAGRSVVAVLADRPEGGAAVYLVPLEGSSARRRSSVFGLDSPFGIPFWDIAAAPGGFEAIWTQPGSADSRLAYRAPNGKVTVLTGHYPLGIFQAPRFVRGEPAGTVAVTTVAYTRNSRVLALFSDSLERGDVAYTPVPSAGADLLLDGLLLRNGLGYVLIEKLLKPSGRGPARKDRRGESIMPGILRSLLLNAKFEPVGRVLSPIGDAPVFEFDADASSGRVFLMATTDRGAVAAVASANENQVSWTGVVDIPSTGELEAPCILATDRNSAVSAAIEASGKPSYARILLGKLTVNRQ